MKASWKFFGLGMAALGLFGVLSTGCDETATGAGGNDALLGIWRHTEIQAGDTTHEETSQLLANGHINTTWADFVHESCADLDGSWSASEDSVTWVMITPVDTTTYVTAYVVDGNTLTITDSTTGEQDVYTKIQAMVDCDHYGWDNLDTWTGSFSATVDGVPTNFSTSIYVENNGGTLGFGGYSGVANMAFVLQSATAGPYTEATCNGTFMPDMNNITDFYLSTDLNLDLITSETDHIVCVFSFEATNPLSLETVTVTNGQIDITFP